MRTFSIILADDEQNILDLHEGNCTGKTRIHSGRNKGVKMEKEVLEMMEILSIRILLLVISRCPLWMD